MKVATIVPTSYLELTKDDDYFMCLAHLVETDDTYAKFFFDRVQEGKFVIMDNGAAEHAQPDAGTILRVAGKVHPSELVLSDVLFHKDETLIKSFEALTFYLDMIGHGVVKFMAVPHGKTFEEWVECAKEFCMCPDIHTIGISKFITNQFGDNARLRAVEALQPFIGDKEIHLLGCWSDPMEPSGINLHCKARGFKGPRGVDSGIAYAFSMKGQIMLKSERPQDEIHFDRADADIELLRDNIQVWKMCCGLGQLQPSLHDTQTGRFDSGGK